MVIKAIRDGLDGKRFSWSAGELNAYRPKALRLGFTLENGAKQLGYKLKPTAKPVGNGYFTAPISQFCDLYVLECHCTPLQRQPRVSEEKSKETPGAASAIAWKAAAAALRERERAQAK